MVNQTEFFRFLGAYTVAGQNVFGCSPRIDQSCQSLRSAVSRNYSEINFRLTENSVLRSETNVARHCQFTSAAESVTVNGCDYRFIKILNFIEYRLPFFRKFPSRNYIRFIQFRDVGACDKSFIPFSGKNYSANRIIFVYFIEQNTKFGNCSVVKRIIF